MNTNSSHKKLKTNQAGLVSIVVAVMLMLIMSLIVLGMSQGTRREQRQTLDRQLSDQAFYNAESGINDAASYLYTTPAAAIEKNGCDTPLGSVTRDIDGPTGVNKVTCILYDKAPKNLQYDQLSVSNPKIIPIQTITQAGTPVELKSLTISWDDATDRDGAITGPCSFNSGSPALPESCGYAGLRAEIFSPASSRDDIRQRSLIAFLLPNATVGSNISVTDSTYPNNQGLISATACNGAATERRCSKTITEINKANLYLTLRSLYRPTNVTITGTDASGAAVRFKDTQTVIDSTGRANDVLRRVQVRIPATAQYAYPGFALQTKDSICKILNVTQNDDGTGNVSPADGRCPVN